MFDHVLVVWETSGAPGDLWCGSSIFRMFRMFWPHKAGHYLDGVATGACHFDDATCLVLEISLFVFLPDVWVGYACSLRLSKLEQAK